jgi:hypothetical protein
LHGVHDFYAHSNYVEQWIYKQSGAVTIRPKESKFGDKDAISKMDAAAKGIPYFDFKAHYVKDSQGKEEQEYYQYNFTSIMSGLLKASKEGDPLHVQVNKDGLDKPLAGALATAAELLNTGAGHGHSGWVVKDGKTTLHDIAVSAAGKHTIVAHDRFLQELKKNKNFKADTVHKDVQND